MDKEEVLGRLADMPVNTWNRSGMDPNIRRMGPTAQDFYAAFGLGNDDKHISTLDANGVALVAIQALYEQLQNKDAQLEAQQRQIAMLEARLAALEVQMGKNDVQ